MLPAFEQSCQVSNLTWVDSISSRRDDIRCRFELKCQLQSNVKPRMNNWLCYMQLDGIKEQSRNMKSPQEGQSRANTCTGQVPEGHRGQETDASGEERFSQCTSSTPGRRLRTSESHDDLLRTWRTKKKRWQHHGRTDPRMRNIRGCERYGGIIVRTEHSAERQKPGSTSAGPGPRCSLRICAVRQISP